MRILLKGDLGQIWQKKLHFCFLKILNYSLIGDLRLLHNMLSFDRCSQLLYTTILAQTKDLSGMRRTLCHCTITNPSLDIFSVIL